MDASTLIKTDEKTGSKIKEPQECLVILLNDDYTTMEFVVEALVAVFHKRLDEAGRIMLDVHEKGKGVVGRYPWDIAATKAEQVHAAARRDGFPLRCALEPA